MSNLLANRDIFLKLIQVMGITGVFYGLFILRVTKLGFKMNDVRSMPWKAFTIGTPIILTTLLS